MKKILLFTILTAMYAVSFGQQIADGFDYPIGNKGYDENDYPTELLEGLSIENNNIYPNNLSTTTERCGYKSGWYNVQDVGSYYNDLYTGYHSGEDWNKTSGDVNEPVYSVANGKVFEINVHTSLGYVIIEHTLPNNDKVYSFYLHVVPSVSVGSNVSRGSQIATIQPQNGSGMTPHLHFGMWAFQVPTNRLKSYFADAASMQSVNIIDPSDFIDANRPGKLNYGIEIFGGSKEQPRQPKIIFTFPHSDFTISNLKIGQTTIPANNIDVVSEPNNYYSFNLLIPANLSGISNNTNYDFSFDLVSNTSGSIFKYYGKNQIFFTDPQLYICDNTIQSCSNWTVKPNDWFKNYVIGGLEKGIFKGYTGSLFKPDENLTREQMAKVIVVAGVELGILEINTNTLEYGLFEDVAPTRWSFPYIQTLRNYGYINRVAKFHKEDNITIGQFSKILTNTLKFTTTDENACYINNGQGIINSNVTNICSDATLIPYMNTLSKVVLARPVDEVQNAFQTIENLISTLRGVNSQELQSTTIVINGNDNVTRAVMAKVIVNAYNYREQNPIGSKKKSGTDLSNWTIIGDKYSLTSTTYGSSETNINHTKTMTAGEVFELGPYSEYINGMPVKLYWTVNGGTLEDLETLTHRHVKFTAPQVTQATDYDLYACFMLGNGKIYNITWKITVEPQSISQVVVPTEPASNITFFNRTSSSISLAWDRGNGDKCLVIAKEVSYVNVWPLDGNTYTPKTDFTGQNLINEIVYVGTGSSVTINGLKSNTLYNFRVFEFNEDNSNTKYFKDQYAENNTMTFVELSKPQGVYLYAAETFLFKIGWQKVPNCDFYKIQISDKIDFSNLLIDENISRSSDVPTYPFQPEEFKTYYTRISSRNPYTNETSAWSDIFPYNWYSDIEPHILSDDCTPKGGLLITGTSVNLSFKAFGGNPPLKYKLYMSKYDPMSQPALVSDIVENTYVVNNLAFNENYKWVVEVTDADGDKAISNILVFNTEKENTVPSGSISIEGGAYSINNPSVSLSLSGTDALGSIELMRFSNDGIIWSHWYEYSTYFGNWDLNTYGGNLNHGTKTVYVQFQDNSGNVSELISDNIILEQGIPGYFIVRNKKFSSLRSAIDYSQSGDNIFVTSGYFDLSDEFDNSPHTVLSSNRTVGGALKQGVNLIGEGIGKSILYWSDDFYKTYALVLGGDNILDGLTIKTNDGQYQLGLGNTITNNITIRNCEFTSGRQAFDFRAISGGARPTNISISNCIIKNAASAWAVNIEGCDNVNFYNNTLVGNNINCLEIESSNNVNVKNNIIAFNKSYAVAIFSCTNLSYTNNNTYNNRFSDIDPVINYADGFLDQTGISGNISSDPLFANLATGNLKLLSNSPSIDAGTNVGIPFIGSPDLGYYEYNGIGSIQINTNINSTYILAKPDGNSLKLTSNQTISNLPIGTYAIYPQDYQGYYKPNPIMFHLGAQQIGSYTLNYIKDTIGPNGQILINKGDYATQSRYVNIFNDVVDDINGLGSGSQMQFSNDGLTWSPNEPILNIKSLWDIGSYGGNLAEGEKNIYARFSDQGGNVSSILTAKIMYLPNSKFKIISTNENLYAAVQSCIAGDIIYLKQGEHQWMNEMGYYMPLSLPQGVNLLGEGKDKVSIVGGNQLTVSSLGQFISLNNIHFKNFVLFDLNGRSSIINCKFTNFSKLDLDNTNSLVANCEFNTLNSLVTDYGFIYSSSFNSTVTNNVFDGGNLQFTGEKAFFIRLSFFKNGIIRNNIILNMNGGGNTGYPYCAGIYIDANSNTNPGDIAITNNTFNNCVANIFKRYGSEPSMIEQNNTLIPNFSNNSYNLVSESALNQLGNQSLIGYKNSSNRYSIGIDGGAYANTSPVAIAFVEPSIGTTNTEFIFTAVNSFDNETQSKNLQYRWDFNSDGIFDTDFLINPTVKYKFDFYDSKPITCWVFDDHMSASYVEIANPLTLQIPENPTNFVVNLTKTMEVCLNWTDNTEIEESFSIYRSTDGVEFNLLASINRNSTTYIDNTIEYNTQYYYYLEAINSNGSSNPSIIKSIVTPVATPQMPSNLVVENANYYTNLLTWNDNSENESAFIVARSINSVEGFVHIDTLSQNTVSYVDISEIVERSTYFYKVIAINDGGAAESEVVEITTQDSRTIIITLENQGAVCASSAIALNTEVSGDFNESNVFLVELSDATGDFTSPLVLSSQQTNTLNTVNCYLPYSMPTGSDYKIRVRSTLPEVVSNTTNSFTINSAPTPSVLIESSNEISCSGSEVVFNATPTNEGTPTYIWSVNGTQVGENSSTFTSSSLQDGDIVGLTMTSTATCSFPSTVYSNEIMVTVNPIVTPFAEIYAENNSICLGSPIQINSSIANGGENTVYNWTLNGVVVENNFATLSTDTITVNTDIQLNIISDASCLSVNNASSEILNLTISALPVAAGQISGNSQVCRNTSETFTVPLIENATSYFWTLPGGTETITETNSISVDFNELSISGNLSVYGVSGCGNGSSSQFSITISETPAAAEAVTGTNTVCQNSTQTYTVPEIANATSYEWTLPNGYIGNSTTNSISVTFDNTAQSGQISVKGVNDCGVGEVSYLQITVNQVPAQAGIITGTNTVCQNSTQTYTVAEIANATSYEWILPSGYTGSSTTNSISVAFDNTAQNGQISVKGVNNCGVGEISNLQITVNQVPAQANMPIGETQLCQNSSDKIYTIEPIANTTAYEWKIEPSTAGEIIGTSTSSSVNWNSEFYGNALISVRGVNTCGTGNYSQTLIVAINQLPAIPTVTQNGNNLISSATTGNQWYNSNGVIQNAVSQMYSMPKSDIYYVVVTQNMCSSQSVSNYYTVTSIENPEFEGNIKIYPNPASTKLYIDLDNNYIGNFNIKIYSVNGSVLKDLKLNKAKEKATFEVVLDNISAGSYFIDMIIKNSKVTKTIIINQ